LNSNNNIQGLVKEFHLFKEEWTNGLIDFLELERNEKGAK